MGLYPFQIVGAQWLEARNSAYLADVMGLGKTVETITAMDAVDSDRFLIVCPASMVGTWDLELRRWSTSNKGAAYIVSFDSLVRSEKVRREVVNFHPDHLIVDEAHYLKSPDSQRSFTILRKIVPCMKRNWFLSGTPTPNGPHELYPIMKTVWPNLCKSLKAETYEDWLNLFCNWQHTRYGVKVWGPKNVNLLREILFTDGRMLRRQFADVDIELPRLDLRTVPLRVWPSEELEMLEDLLGTDVLWALEQDSVPQGGHIASLRRLIGEAKTPAASAILYDELKEDPTHKKVVFAYHINVLDELEQKFSEFGVTRLDGSTTKGQRTERVRLFQENPGVRVFLGQIHAAGVGITLTESSDVSIVEPSWVPSENNQAIARIRRIGQRAATVTARMFILAHSLDEQIMGVLLRKQRTLATTIDG